MTLWKFATTRNFSNTNLCSFIMFSFFFMVFFFSLNERHYFLELAILSLSLKIPFDIYTLTLTSLDREWL